MTNADTVAWLLQQMQGACKIGLPMVGRTGWPNPVAADQPGLRRTLGETDLQRALGLARRRGITNASIGAAWNAAKASHPDGVNNTWIAKFIDFLDNLPPGNYPADHGRQGR
jgi:hypothetical protein